MQMRMLQINQSGSRSPFLRQPFWHMEIGGFVMKKKTIAAALAGILTVLSFQPFPAHGADEYEWESGTIYDTGTAETTVVSLTGASGGKAVNLLDAGDSVTLRIRVPSAGAYTLSIRYSQPYDEGGKIQNVLINGKQTDTVSCGYTASGSFETASVTANLKAGENTVTVESSWGWTYLDTLTVTPWEGGAASVDAVLSDQKATAKTQALYAFLCDTYGKHVLAGQQESTWMGSEDYEFNIIQKASGKLPVIRGLDYMGEDFAGCNRRAKAWAAKGGIVTICWHCGDQFKGSHTEAMNSEPDWSKLLTPGTSEYNALIAGMDKGAAALKELQDADIPVIWRPFHEFDGGWFWWGKGGAENFKKLWKLMYDRYTNEWGLHNLIWNLGYTGDVKDGWYTGDAYVDIIGADTYVDHTDSLFSMYQRTVNVAKKPVCLHENGPIPDPEKMEADHANWLWFMTWHTSFIDSNAINTASYLNQVYNSDYMLTLDEIPDVYHYSAASHHSGDDPDKLQAGDVNADGSLNAADVALLQQYLLGAASLTEQQAAAADSDQNGKLNAADLSLLKQKRITPAAPPKDPDPQEQLSPAEYVQKMQSKIVGAAPDDIFQQKAGVEYGEFRSCTYWSTTRERETPVNVLLPPGYQESEQYPVFYMMHGYYDNETWMTRPVVGVQNMMGNLIAAGEAKKMILVFPYIYTSKTMPYVTGMDAVNNQNYDNFIYDLQTDLMPYIEKTFPVKTGRENTAISGFSMGGRESLYIGMKCADRFGYVGSVCSAPGVTELIPEGQFGFSPMPQLLMISAAVHDGMVGTNPEYYHNLYTQKGVPHIWNQIPSGAHDETSVKPHLYNFVRCLFQ